MRLLRHHVARFGPLPRRALGRELRALLAVLLAFALVLVGADPVSGEDAAPCPAMAEAAD